jgi:hypothetical protein
MRWHDVDSRLSVILIKWAVYISSRRDFSHADSLRAEAQAMRALVEGQEKRRRLEPAVLRVRTLVYRFEGWFAVAGTVTEPRTWTNCKRDSN